MPRVRIQFSKGDPVKFLSHLDILRTFERALRRGQVRMKYSEGYHPKAKIAFASALAVGVTSAAEYADLEVETGQSAPAVLARLQAALPPGLDAAAAREISPQAPALMAVVNTASYRIVIDPGHPRPDQVVALKAEPEIWIERQGKKGRRLIDIRPWIYDLRWTQDSILLTAASGSEGNLRVHEVLSLFHVDPNAAAVHRTGLWIKKGDALLDPLQEDAS